MCGVSALGDQYSMRPDWQRFINRPVSSPQTFPLQQFPPAITREEFDALKRDVLEMKELLKAAKAEDERAGNPDCEMGEKVAILRKVADLVGVNLDDVFGKKAPPSQAGVYQ